MSSNNRTSDLINSQVPFFIRSDHRTFVAFLEAYYEYLEQSVDTPLNQGKIHERAQNLLNYFDVDKTLHDFSEKFYDVFLKLLPKNEAVDKEVLIKNIKDFYRAKGTEKSLKFLLRILENGSDAEIYYPKIDILRASDGKWYIQKSLRVRDIAVDGVANTSRGVLELFASKIVTGNTSNATATIDRTDRFFENGFEISELVISSDHGNFQNGEFVRTTFLENGATRQLSANVFGGLDSIIVTVPGSGYFVGNTVIIESTSGSGAAAYVSQVSSGNVANISVAAGGAGFLANGYVLFSGGGGGSGANAMYTTIDTSERYHPNTYNIFSSTINLEANTRLNVANYANLNHLQISMPNANTLIINALSSFVYGPVGPITGVQLNSVGDNYLSVPSADAIANSVVKSLGILGRMEIVDGGLLYTAGDRIQFYSNTTGWGANAQVASVFANGKINTVKFTANAGWIIGGFGYNQSSLPRANVATSTGNGANIIVRAILGDGEQFNLGTTTIGQIEEITITSRGDGYTETPTINLTQSGDGQAQAVATFVSGVFTYPGRYLNDDGHLSSYNFLQNRDYYQNFSYVVKVHKAISEYRSYIHNLVHPAGLKLFGEYITEDNAPEQNTCADYVTDRRIVYHTGSFLVANTSNSENIQVTYTSGHSLVTNDNVYIEFVSGNLANLSNGLYRAMVASNTIFYISHSNNAVSSNTGNVMFGRII